jgi:hypothetical protein
VYLILAEAMDHTTRRVAVLHNKEVGIPMGTNCDPLLVDLFLYSYEADFIQGLLVKNEKKLARFFNLTFPSL